MAKEPDLKSGEAERCGGSSPPPSAIHMTGMTALLYKSFLSCKFVFCKLYFIMNIIGDGAHHNCF